MIDGDGVDLERLAGLRERFLDATAVRGPVADYWSADEDLAAYDAVFAARIGWKWDAVADELRERGFAPARDDLVVDWGCGSGIAVRRFVAAFGAGRIALHDRSPRAMRFAQARVLDELGLASETLASCAALEPGVLLISHVLDELDARAELELDALIARSRRIVWVEPGSRAVSRLLSAHRDRLAGDFSILAPCPHERPCSVLADPDDRHWCHFFAPPPRELFTDGSWVRLARRLGIDLRALPYAFIALARRDEVAVVGGPTGRVLGRPEVSAREVKLYVCSATGLERARFDRRAHPALYRAAKKRPDTLRSIEPPRGDADQS